MGKLSVVSIYVSHNSERYIKKFSNRHRDELGDKIIIVNSSSKVISASDFPWFQVINIGKNIGFSAANNVGVETSLEYDPDCFVFVNPDVYLPEGWLKLVEATVTNQKYSDVGIFTVPLLGYDIEKDVATGLIDGVGVFSTLYGRWFDRWAGDSVEKLSRNDSPYHVPAACGAMMIVRCEVIKQLLHNDDYVFNESYFMYKEDIELSLRVRALGKTILMIPNAPAFHCRGWDGRRDSAYWKRLLSAKNELSMHCKHRWKYVPFSALKYLYVKYVEKK